MPRINHNGYVEIYIPNHHRARGNGYVFEHIIILEKKLGRKLEPGEQAHHINGIRTDNRPENLEVIDIVEHSKLTAKIRREKNMHKCNMCGKEVYRKPSHIKRCKGHVFCSQKCNGMFGMKNNIKGRFNYA